MRWLYKTLRNPDFVKARLIAYAVVAAYALVMLLFDPFDYSCGPENPCPGCGFRAGLWLVLTGRISEGLQANFFVGSFWSLPHCLFSTHGHVSSCLIAAWANDDKRC